MPSALVVQPSQLFANVLKDTTVGATLFRPKEGSVLLVTIALAVRTIKILAHVSQAFIAPGLLKTIQNSKSALKKTNSSF